MAGLTALQVKSAKPGRHADGRGLYLIVRDSGSRSWMLRAQVAGKRQDIGIGSAKRVTLAQARAKASELRERLEAGEEIRPRAVVAAPKAAVPTFSEATRACHEAIKSGWRNADNRRCRARES